jgi:hypothetical protein
MLGALEDGANKSGTDLSKAGSRILMHWPRSEVSMIVHGQADFDASNWTSIEIIVTESAVILTSVAPISNALGKAGNIAAYTLGPIASLLVSGVGGALSDALQKGKLPPGTYSDPVRSALFANSRSIFAERRALKLVQFTERGGLFSSASHYLIVEGNFKAATGDVVVSFATSSPYLMRDLEKAGLVLEKKVVPDMVKFLIDNSKNRL